MRRAAALIWVPLLLAALAGCGPPPFAQEKPRVFPPLSAGPTLAARLPRRAELACFPCHSHVKFDKGPFPHASIGHKGAGHCHRCHVGIAGHGGRAIEKNACLSCHQEEAEELKILSRSGSPSR